jgi:AcrR family transcriptional regulator
MPKLTEAHFAARKEQILKAAFQCLARKGYSRLTVRDIAAEAGISVGTLYLHFDNKQGIVKALVERGRELDEAGLEGIPAEGGPLEALGAVFEFLIERLDDPDEAATVRVDVELWAEAIHRPAVKELFQDSQRYWLGRLSGLVEEAQKVGELPDSVDPAGLAQLLIAMFAGLELMKVMEPEVPLGPLVEPLRTLLRGHLDTDLDSRTD